MPYSQSCSITAVVSPIPAGQKVVIITAPAVLLQLSHRILPLLLPCKTLSVTICWHVVIVLDIKCRIILIHTEVIMYELESKIQIDTLVAMHVIIFQCVFFCTGHVCFDQMISRLHL